MNSLFGELLPEWIDPELWAAFIEMRKAKGKHAPLTETGKKLLIMKLDRLRSQGHPVNEIIAESVMNGWSGLFPIAKREFTPTIVSGSQPIYKHQEVPQTPEAVNRGLDGLRAARRRMMEAKVK